MRPLRYSINVTSDGCCDHRVMIADEDLHRHAAENLAQADPSSLSWEPTKLWSRVAAGGADGSGARLDANDRLSPPQAIGQSPVVLTIYDERQAGSSRRSNCFRVAGYAPHATGVCSAGSKSLVWHKVLVSSRRCQRASLSIDVQEARLATPNAIPCVPHTRRIFVVDTTRIIPSIVSLG